jgi:hypothetical protein
VPELAGWLAFVTVIPPALYPEPVTSPVALYAVVAAFTVALARYNAALSVSAPVPALITVVPSACMPLNISVLKLVVSACVLAIRIHLSQLCLLVVVSALY